MEQDGLELLVQGHVCRRVAEPVTPNTPGPSPLLPSSACILPLRWDGVTQRQSRAEQSPGCRDGQYQTGLRVRVKLRGRPRAGLKAGKALGSVGETQTDLEARSWAEEPEAVEKSGALRS